MNKLLKLGIAVISLFVIILAIIIIIQLIHPAISAQLTEAYATSALAVVTVLAVFYQSITKYIKRPKFDVEFAPDNEEIRLKIINNGGSTAHLCRIAIEVYNDGDNTMIMPLFLPWDIQNSSLEVTYEGIVLYRYEYEFVKLFSHGINCLEVYGYPYGMLPYTNPPLGTNIMGKNKVEYEKIYKIKITVFCEEISQKCLKTIYFKVEQNNTFKYGFNNKMEEPPWLIPKINARSVPESK